MTRYGRSMPGCCKPASSALGIRGAIVLPDGEEYKSWESLNVYDALLENRCDRQTTLVALGSGVVVT
jgi:3-dehydroquinate synthetase